jgi:hypothetical protein
MKHRGVQGGTPFGAPLCRTCHHAQCRRGAAEGQESLYCSDVGKTLQWEAVECSNYENKNLPKLDDMRKVAWLLRTDSVTKKIFGFVAPGEQTAEERRSIKYDD